MTRRKGGREEVGHLLGEEQMKKVIRFKYTGKVIQEGGKLDKEINSTVGSESVPK